MNRPPDARSTRRRDLWVIPVLLLLLLVYLLQSSQGARPVAIGPGSALGRALFAPGDAAGGGHGQPVDGFTCGPTTARTVAVAHLALVVEGVLVQVPRDVGLGRNRGRPCRYPLFSVGSSGLVALPAKGYPTLGEFFDIWGEPLAAAVLGRFHGPVHAFVGTTPYPGEARGIVLVPGTQVTVEVGSPILTPPRYTFPARLSLTPPSPP